jgi:hypothetical protein
MVALLLIAALAVPTSEVAPKVVKKRRCHRCAVVRPYNAKLDRMAWCESRRRWFISTGNGYYGGLQFDLRTWRSVGGWGYPHWNSILEQKYRAVLLIRRRGYRPWPVCGYA